MSRVMQVLAVLSVTCLLAMPLAAQETYNVKVISAGTDWFKVIMMEIGAEDIIDGSSVELVSTLLPIHNFDLNTDFFVNGGELSYSRVPLGPSDVQVDFDVHVNYELKLACMKGSLGTLTIQLWHNNVLQEEYVNDETGDWCFQNWNFFPGLGAPGEGTTVPNTEALSQNYPNPFNPSTTIVYDLQRAGDVQVNIYNSAGQMVATLIDDYYQPGNYSVLWDGKNAAGTAVASGTYFYELVVDNQHQAKQMILLK